MADERTGPITLPPPASDGESPKTSDVEVLPKGGAPTDRIANSITEMVQVQTGQAALAGAFASLPEATQRQALENEALRFRQFFELEIKDMELQAKERADACRKRKSRAKKPELARSAA